MAYQTPANDIVSIIDAPPTPVAALGPGRRFAALVHYESHPPVAVLARPFLSLGGHPGRPRRSPAGSGPAGSPGCR